MKKEILSRQNEQIKNVVKLNDSKYRKEAGLFKVDGFHMFEMAKEAGCLVEVYVLEEIKDLDSKINQYIVSKEIMEKISSSKTPQGIVSICKMKQAKEVEGNKVLLLDGVSDPGNLGTLLRTALAFGFNDVVLMNNCCSIYNEKVLQSSQGAIFFLNIVLDKNIDELKQKGYKLYSTEIKGSESIEKVTKPAKLALVLGNEAHGVSKEILDKSDKRVRIDINNIESLNVAIAGAIAMYIFR